MKTKPTPIHFPTDEEKSDALRDFFASARNARIAAGRAEADLRRHAPALISAIAGGTGQGQRVAAITRSVWNGCHQVGLCDALSGLDHQLALAVLALIAARLHMSGDAAPLIRHILEASGELARMRAESTTAAAA